jgi:hypothetical protein
MTPTCGSCGSARVLRHLLPIAHGFMGPSRISVRGPATSALRGRASSDLSADVCVDCGGVEFRVVDVSALKQAYKALDGPTLGLDP